MQGGDVHITVMKLVVKLRDRPYRENDRKRCSKLIVKGIHDQPAIASEET